MKVYQRTENGTTTYVSVQDGMAEINNAMMAGKRNVREMSSLNATDYAIQYKDGRSVRLVRTDAPAPEGFAVGQTVVVNRPGQSPITGTVAHIHTAPGYVAVRADRDRIVSNYPTTFVSASKTEAPESANGRRIVAVKGKRYVVGTIVPARPKTEGVATWVPQPYVNYWAGGPLGIPSGPTRLAKASMRPGTVGRAIWDAVSAS